MGKMHNVSRRDFLKVGAAAGCTAATIGVLGGCANQAQISEKPTDPQESKLEEEVDQEQSVTPMIYLIDRMVTKPGKGREVYDAYTERLSAIATAKGMTLEHAIIAPPIWLTDEVSNNTLEFIWSFEGYGELAAAISYGDREATDWWQNLEKDLESRDRSYFSTETDVEVLCQ